MVAHISCPLNVGHFAKEEIICSCCCLIKPEVVFFLNNQLFIISICVIDCL